VYHDNAREGAVYKPPFFLYAKGAIIIQKNMPKPADNPAPWSIIYVLDIQRQDFSERYKTICSRADGTIPELFHFAGIIS
jgi:hypothetical protein